MYKLGTEEREAILAASASLEHYAEGHRTEKIESEMQKRLPDLPGITQSMNIEERDARYTELVAEQRAAFIAENGNPFVKREDFEKTRRRTVKHGAVFVANVGA